MTNKINLEIKENNQSFAKYNIVSDKQLYEAWNETVEKSDFEFEASSLTEIYTKLYNVSQSSDLIPNDVEFYIEGELFAKMVDGYHLAMTEELKNEIFDKYKSEQTIDFITADTIKPVYGEERKVDGLTVYRNDDIRAYTGYDSDNYISDSSGNNVFKTEDEAKKAIDYYLLEDSSAYDIKFIDKTTLTVNGEAYKTFSMNKEISPTKEVNRKRRQKRRL